MMSFAQIFEETMKAMANNDTARLEELSKIHDKKVAEIRAKKA